MSLLLRVSGGAAVAVGLVATLLGSLWAPRTIARLYDAGLGFPLDALIPFLPIFSITLGALMMVKSRE